MEVERKRGASQSNRQEWRNGNSGPTEALAPKKDWRKGGRERERAVGYCFLRKGAGCYTVGLDWKEG